MRRITKKVAPYVFNVQLPVLRCSHVDDDRMYKRGLVPGHLQTMSPTKGAAVAAMDQMLCLTTALLMDNGSRLYLQMMHF